MYFEVPYTEYWTKLDRFCIQVLRPYMDNTDTF